MPKRIDLGNYIVQTCDSDFKISSLNFQFRDDHTAINYFNRHYTDSRENNLRYYLIYSELLKIDKFTGEHSLLTRYYF